jgi:hypothetical protein
VVGSLRGALGQTAIRRVVVAWTAGIVADWAYLVAMLVVAYREGGALGVGLLGVARMAPVIVLGPLAGGVIRRFPGERALLAAHGMRAGAMVATAVLLAAEAPVAGAFVLAAIAAGAGTLVRPIQTALLPAFARTPGELVASNVVASTGEGLGTFAGPLVGGLVLAVAGAAWGCAAGAALGAGATIALVGVRSDESASGRSAAPGVGRFDPAAGAGALLKRPAAAVLVGAFTAQTFVRGLLTTLLVVASLGILELGEAGVGLLNGSIGAGGLAGAVVGLGLVGRARLAPAFAVALVLWGLPIAFLGAVPLAAAAVAAMAVTGAGNAVLDVAGFTLLQRTVPAGSRVAVFALFEGLLGAGLAAGGLVAPLLLELAGPQGALLATGAILPVLAVVGWPRLSRTDDEVVIPARQLALLRGVPLFEPLPLTALERLAASAVPVEFDPGEALMTQGERGDRYVVIDAGEVDIESDGQWLRDCGPGNGIGEIALIRRVPRTATARARTAVRAWAIDSDAFLDAVATPASAAAAAVIIQDRLRRLARVRRRRRVRARGRPRDRQP